MNHLIRIGGLAACLAAASPASAAVFWSNFDLGTGAATQKRNFLPLDYRAPAETFGNGAARVGVGCANAFCTAFQWHSAQFEFSVGSTFTASHAIVGIRRNSGAADQRLGFSFEHFDTATNSWKNFDGNNHFQIHGNNLPIGQTVDAEVPFGTNATGSYQFYSFRPIRFVAGETYRVTAGHWAGGIGTSDWMLSDVASDSATFGDRYNPRAGGKLGFQPTLAFTDGQGITFSSAVPEPSTWALLILGFGGIGWGMRRRGERRLAAG